MTLSRFSLVNSRRWLERTTLLMIERFERIDRSAIKITTLHDRTNDYTFWISRSPEERLAALEFLRQQHITSTHNVQQRLQRALQLLNDHAVEHLLVGGYAVGFYGYPRYTRDLDIWVRSTTENGERMIKVLEEFGFGSLKVSAHDFTKEYAVIQLGYPPLRIDIMTTLDGVNFVDCYGKRRQVVVDDVAVAFISLDDLRMNKRAANRARDINDLENLQ